MSDGRAHKFALQVRADLTGIDLIGLAQHIKQEVFALETIAGSLHRCSGMVSRDPGVRAEMMAVGEGNGEGSSHRLVCTSAGLGFQGTLISKPGMDFLRKVVTKHKLALTDREVGAADGEYVIEFPKSSTQI